MLVLVFSESYPQKRKNSVLRTLTNGQLTYPCLLSLQKRGFRNGNWIRLRTEERALFRCAQWVARVKGRISNTRLMVEIFKVALRLIEGEQSTIRRAGRLRAAAMLQKYGEVGGVFSWAPQVKNWLNESGFLQYLGIMGTSHH